MNKICQSSIIELANGQGIFNDPQIAKDLTKHKIQCKTIGFTQNQNTSTNPPYLLNPFEMGFIKKHKLYLINQSLTEHIKLNQFDTAVYNYLKPRFYLIMGHKFGATFLAYEENPRQSHAKYLIFTEEELNLLQMSRLAEIARKIPIYASRASQDKIVFYQISRNSINKDHKKDKKYIKLHKNHEKSREQNNYNDE